MSKLFRALVVSLQFFSLAAACAAQGVARPPKDEEPLAVALRLIRARPLDDDDRDEAFFELFRAHVAAGRLEEAAGTARSMDDGRGKALALSRLANSFAEAGKLERAEELLSESLLVLKHRGDSGWSTRDLLFELVEGERTIDAETFSYRSELRKGALAYLFNAGRADAATAILSHVTEAARDPDFGDRQAALMLTGAARLTAASDASKAASLLAEALDAARRVEEGRAAVWTLCDLARAHADLGDKKGAEALLDEAQLAASTLGDDGEDELRDVAYAYAKMGLREKALKALPPQGADGLNPSGFAVEAAAAGGPEAVKESLARAFARVASLESEYEKSQALENLAASCGAREPDLLADVLRAALELRDDYHRAEVLAAVGDGYAAAGRKDAALDAWSHAYESARVVKLRKRDFVPSSSVRGDAENLRLLRLLGTRFVRAGEYGRANEVARDMRAVQARTRPLAAAGGVSVREADAAIAALADELTRAGQKEAALSVLAEAGAAEEKLDETTNPVERADALLAVGAAYAKAGDTRRAAAYFRRALRLAETNSDFNTDNQLRVLIEVGSRYAEAELTPDARARKSLRNIVREVEADKD
ncbi:MAG TPA: hypothetical protein VF297_18980 [Pyrinomonadaceae bacterium]